MKTGNTPAGVRLPSRHDHASMEPGHEDREYRLARQEDVEALLASMEPGHEDREYRRRRHRPIHPQHASMEPGHEDREYITFCQNQMIGSSASMEPGHEDREYRVDAASCQVSCTPQWSPVMKTGNTRDAGVHAVLPGGLNGARS